MALTPPQHPVLTIRERRHAQGLLGTKLQERMVRRNNLIVAAEARLGRSLPEPKDAHFAVSEHDVRLDRQARLARLALRVAVVMAPAGSALRHRLQQRLDRRTRNVFDRPTIAPALDDLPNEVLCGIVDAARAMAPADPAHHRSATSLRAVCRAIHAAVGVYDFSARLDASFRRALVTDSLTTAYDPALRFLDGQPMGVVREVAARDGSLQPASVRSLGLMTLIGHAGANPEMVAQLRWEFMANVTERLAEQSWGSGFDAPLPGPQRRLVLERLEDAIVARCTMPLVRLRDLHRCVGSDSPRAAELPVMLRAASLVKGEPGESSDWRCLRTVDLVEAWSTLRPAPTDADVATFVGRLVAALPDRPRPGTPPRLPQSARDVSRYRGDAAWRRLQASNQSAADAHHASVRGWTAAVEVLQGLVERRDLRLDRDVAARLGQLVAALDAAGT